MISVIIPVYNASSRIRQCIDSVLQQTYKEFEVILVDDGSTDDSQKICKEYCDNSVHYIFQKNAGAAAARNKGLEAASGEFICFLDSDDYLERNALDIMMKRFDEETDIVCGCCKVDNGLDTNVEYFFESDYIMKTPKEKTRLYLQLMDNNYGQPQRPCYTAIGVPWGKIYRRRIIDDGNLKFNILLRRMQDNIFNMYAFAQARKIKYINEPVVSYRIEHLKTVSYLSYGIYEEVLRERDSFFSTHNEYYNEEIKSAHIKEKADALFQAIKREMVQTDESLFFQKVRSICNVPYFQDFILSNDSKKINKMRMIRLCYRLDNYYLLKKALKWNMKK